MMGCNELRILCLLLCVSSAFSTCMKGMTGSGGNCKYCPNTLTTEGEGDNLPCNVCDYNYFGTAPDCKPCTKGDDAYLTTSINGKCMCTKNAEGTFPNCKLCPFGLGTPEPGDGQKCGCVQEDIVSFGCSSCDASKAFYKPELPNWPRQPGPYGGGICMKCNKDTFSYVKTVKGEKVCSCDTKKGYGFKGPIAKNDELCIKCKGVPGRQLDAKGRCVCSKGYAVSPSPWGEYCIKCDDTTTNIVDKDGYCKCKPGYGFNTDGSKCLPCSGAGYLKTKAGFCQCKPGYFGSMQWFQGIEDPRAGKCQKCGAGMGSYTLGGNPMSVCFCKDKGAAYKDTSKLEAGCKCRWGFKPSPKGCAYDKYCKSGTYTVEFWSGGKLPKNWNGKHFPKTVLRHKPTATKQVKIAKTDTLILKQADIPSGVNKGKYVARVRRCSCVYHESQDSQFDAWMEVNGGGGGALLTIDGGTTGRCEGDYHDQNICMRPGVIPVIPVSSTIRQAGKAVTVTFPQYNPRQGGWLSGFDYIPIMSKYEACHNITLEYWSTGTNTVVSLKIPKQTVF